MAKKISVNSIRASIIKDFGEVKMALESLAGTGAITTKDINKVLMDAAQPLIADMKSRAPKDTGRLANSITVWSAKRRPYRVYVGPSYKLWAGGRIAHIIEYGTVERFMKKGLRAGGITQSTMEPFKGKPEWVPYKGKSTGVVPARPFIRPAVEATQTQVIERLRNNMLVVIANKAKKAGLKVA